MIIKAVYEAAGLIPVVDVAHYPPDWHMHREAERYMSVVLDHAHEVETPKPGDLVLWKFGRCFSHGAIVVEWPTVIHAYIGRNVCLEDAEKATWLNFIGENTSEQGRPRPRKYFSLWRDP